jgi:hypothetical protein
MNSTRWIFTAVLVTGAAMAGCSRGFVANVPAGFAEIPSHTQLKALSPDGVTFRVRRETVRQAAELPFWKEALKKRMLDAGYGFVSEKDIKAQASAGYLIEVAAPMGAEDYSYTIAIFVQDKHIVIAEAAGEVTRYKAHAKDILAAIEHIAL